MKVLKFTASFLCAFAQCPLWGIALLVSPAISGVPQLQPSKQPKFCIDYNFNGQYISTSSMAVSDRYIVFGNDKTNQVTIYQRDDQDRWLKFRTITPPADSPFAKIGSGFGTAVAFDQDTLIIGAYAESNSSTRQELFQQVADNGQYFANATYKTSISTDGSIFRIDDNSAPREIAGGSMAIHNSRIAFGVHRFYASQEIPSYINVLSGRNVLSIKEPAFNSRWFGRTVALRDNLLVTTSVGTGSNKAPNGNVWIYDLDKPTSKPRKVALDFPVNQVRISRKFIVANGPNNQTNPNTLILNRLNGAKAIIAGNGIIDVNDRMMVRSHTGADYGEVFIPAQLEIFDLRKKLPQLLEKRKGVYLLTLLSENFLFSVERKDKIDNICIEWTSI
jgi:hypothetical protein